jgi:hypothetical protein
MDMIRTIICITRIYPAICSALNPCAAPLRLSSDEAEAVVVGVVDKVFRLTGFPVSRNRAGGKPASSSLLRGFIEGGCAFGPCRLFPPTSPAAFLIGQGRLG